MKRLMIAVILTAALVIGGTMAYRHFVTNQIKDRDGMENPFLTETPELPEIPSDAALLSLNWSQSDMCYDDCFQFDLTAEGGAYVISGECTDLESDDRVERENAPLTAEDWAGVEQHLRDSEHRAKTELPEDIEVCDGADSTLSVVWRTAEGDAFSVVYDGAYEPELRKMLTALLTAVPAEEATP